MSKINVMSFRVSVPNATPAAAPLSVSLDAMSSCLEKVVIFASAAVDFSKCGFRLRNHTRLIVPDHGSSEAGITLLAQEQNWAPLVNSPIDLIFAGRDLDGAPFNLTLDFYNTTGAAIMIGGFLHTRMPEHTIHDLVIELKRYQEKIAPIHYDKEVIQDRQSSQPPYPMQQIEKR